MVKLKHPELLDEALTLLGPLPPEEREAVRVVLVDTCERLFEPQGETYHESMETLKAAEDDVQRLRQRLRGLNPHLTLISPTLSDLFPLPPGWKWYLDSPENPKEPRFKVDIVLQVLEERLRAAQEEVAIRLNVKGGHGRLQSRIYGPPKSGFVDECSLVWLLAGNSLDDGKSGELVRFTHLVYEAATGDENSKGLRDKIAIARKKVREWFAAQAAQEDMMEYEQSTERIVRRKAANPYSVAILTLLQGYRTRSRP